MRKIEEIADKVHYFKLEHVIDSGELAFFLTIPVKGKQLSDVSSDEFQKAVENYFKLKKVEYYFQLTQVTRFPQEYKLGFGTLLTFDSLPEQVKDCAKSLSKGEVPDTVQSVDEMWRQIIQALTIPVDPKAGQWLKVATLTISSSTSWGKGL